MSQSRRGNIERHGAGFRFRYYAGDVRRSDSFKTLAEAQEAMRQYQIGLGVIKPLQRGTDQSGVYFLRSEANGLTKIGHSVEIERRVSSLRTSSSVRLSVVGRMFTKRYVEAERFCHSALRHRRVHGEWFQLTMDDVNQVMRDWQQNDPSAAPYFGPDVLTALPSSVLLDVLV